MDKRYQVFVSSTYSDLEEERQHVMQVLLEYDAIPSGMELFPAANQEQWELIKRVIDDCDYYIVIVAGRYGSIGPDGFSYTEMEYRYALERNKPILGFIHKNPETLPLYRCETNPDNIVKFQNFCELVKKKHCKMWTSPLDLAMKVGASFYKITKDFPAVGWVRADTVSNDQTVKEIFRQKEYIEELEEQVVHLKNRLAEIKIPAQIETVSENLQSQDSTVESFKDLEIACRENSQSTDANFPYSFAESHKTPIIKVIGIGGGGCNAINRIAASQLQGVSLIAANTDAQALEHCYAETKILLGKEYLRGLGAGSDPKVGRKAALESIDAIKTALNGATVVFVVAGLGGGTGSGAMPVIAQAAKDLGALTIGVVTKPFYFEGKKRLDIADTALEELRPHLDSLITISNDKLIQLAQKKATFIDMFRLSDDMLLQTIKGISDLLVVHGLISLDIADVSSVLSDAGLSTVGIGVASGEGRASKAALRAITNPLAEDSPLDAASGILINITCGKDVMIEEIEEAVVLIQEAANKDAMIFFGTVFDDTIGDEMRITIVASGA